MKSVHVLVTVSCAFLHQEKNPRTCYMHDNFCFSNLETLQVKIVTEESQEQGKLKRKTITLRNLRHRSGLRLLIAS